MGIIKGKKLMVFVETSSNTYKSLGFATNHTLSTTANTVDVAHKDFADVAGGRWDDQEIDTLSWTVTSENFYASDVEGASFEDLFAIYAAGTEVTLKWGVAADSTTGVPDGGWAVPSAGLTGKAIITSLDMNAPVSDRATYSVQFTGKGPLTTIS
jgi:predicted secreted protein